jgi:hypothetical protein
MYCGIRLTYVCMYNLCVCMYVNTYVSNLWLMLSDGLFGTTSKQQFHDHVFRFARRERQK